MATFLHPQWALHIILIIGLIISLSVLKISKTLKKITLQEFKNMNQWLILEDQDLKCTTLKPLLQKWEEPHQELITEYHRNYWKNFNSLKTMMKDSDKRQLTCSKLNIDYLCLITLKSLNLPSIIKIFVKRIVYIYQIS